MKPCPVLLAAAYQITGKLKGRMTLWIAAVKQQLKGTEGEPRLEKANWCDTEPRNTQHRGPSLRQLQKKDFSWSFSLL